MKTFKTIEGHSIIVDECIYNTISIYTWRVALDSAGRRRVYRMTGHTRVYLSGVVLGSHSSLPRCHNNQWNDYTKKNIGPSKEPERHRCYENYKRSFKRAVKKYNRIRNEAERMKAIKKRVDRMIERNA